VAVLGASLVAELKDEIGYDHLFLGIKLSLTRGHGGDEFLDLFGGRTG
jgi:hypothetical protein